MSRKALAIAACYFFLTGALGCWTPVLSKILQANDWGPWIVVAFLIKPIASFVAPLAISAQADQRIPAQRIILVLLLLSALLHVVAFRELQVGESPLRFAIWFALQSLVTAPTMALLNTITFVHLEGEVGRFGSFRVWGTLGWIAAGWIVSLLRIDSSATVGYLAAGLSFVAACCCLALPNVAPQAARARTLAERLGLSSLKLLWSRGIGVVVIGSCLFMMPLTAFYMHTPLFVSHLGIERIAATMSLGQLTEVLALFGMSYLMRRFSYRTLLVSGFAFAILRYLLFAVADQDSVWMLFVGITFHGLCWSLFFEVGRAFLYERAPAEYRAQVQALVALGTSGVGSIGGTLLVGLAYNRLVLNSPGWPNYWWLLTVWCAVCGVGFVLAFRERERDRECSVE